MLWKKLKIKELEPDMELMDDIYCPHTGILLLKTGTVLREPLLSSLQKKHPNQFCYVRSFFEEVGEKDVLTTTSDCSEPEGAFFLEEITEEDSQEDINFSITDFLDREAREIFVQACRILNRIYSSRKIKPYFRELYTIIENLVGKLLIHPEMMIYAALQKKIDKSIFDHAVNVCVFSVFLGRLAGLKETILRELALAGIMHDIGRMDIPAEIWHKKGCLTGPEFNKVKEHCLYSYFRLASLDQVDRQSLVGVLQHHERLDGSGYPHGLKKDELHLWSRILGITDVFDAYTSERVYRKAHSHYQGLEYLRQNSARFDKSLLNSFIRHLSFFPIGSRVLLSTGEKGIIMGIHKHTPYRPIIRVRKKDGTGEKLLDLTDNRSIYIERLI